MNKFKEINNILDNHNKLLSMLNSKVLPIKEMLIKDINDVKELLEKTSKKEKNT
jgi:hypothetical protein